MTKVIITAGGKGERLKPLTDSLAKPMVKVGGKPILEHLIYLFKNQGFIDFIFSLCYLPETIKSYFGDGSKFGVNISYTYEDPKNPLGNAAVISMASSQLTETFIVTSGDVLRSINVKEILDKHRESGVIATLVLYRNHKEVPTSMVTFNDRGLVDQFIERPSKEQITKPFVWTNASFYVFEPKIKEFIKKDEVTDFGYHVFPKLLKVHEKILAFPKDHYLVDIGTKEKLDQANRDFENGLIPI